jgi:drug/metabolite transporter (DMT)-like permease
MTTGDDTVAAPAVRTDMAALAAGLVTVLAWGSAFVGIRAAGETLSPGPLALGRLIVSLAVLGTVAAVRREGFPPGLFAGCAVAFCGVVVIGLATAESGARSGLGVALCIVAATAYAVAVVVQKPVLGRVSSFQVTWLGLAAATVACLPFAPALASEAATADASTIGWTIYLGVVPTALGFAAWAFALRRTSAGRMGSITYLAPPVAILLGWAVLGETPPWLAAAGGALCLGGVALARRR